jgi:hypothetical protein
MAVKILKEIQEFIKGRPGWVATASKDGMPNVAIKGSLRVLDDENLAFADLFSLKSRKNLEENPLVAVMVADMESHKGYILKGKAELISEGALYEQTAKVIAEKGMPSPKYVVKIPVDSIFDQSVGPDAGKQIV